MESNQHEVKQTPEEILKAYSGQHPCPKCGYCPTCGRSRYPYYPQWDWTPQSYPYTTTITWTDRTTS